MSAPQQTEIHTRDLFFSVVFPQNLITDQYCIIQISSININIFLAGCLIRQFLPRISLQKIIFISNRNQKHFIILCITMRVTATCANWNKKKARTRTVPRSSYHAFASPPRRKHQLSILFIEVGFFGCVCVCIKYIILWKINICFSFISIFCINV